VEGATTFLFVPVNGGRLSYGVVLIDSPTFSHKVHTRCDKKDDEVQQASATRLGPAAPRAFEAPAALQKRKGFYKSTTCDITGEELHVLAVEYIIELSHKTVSSKMKLQAVGWYR